MQQWQHPRHRFIRGVMMGGLIGGSILVAGTPALRAQQAPASDAVVLEYKYAAGRTQKFRTSMTADFMLTPEGGPAGLGGLPMSMKMQVFTSEKVLSSQEKTGTISSKLDAMQFDLNILGQQTSVKAENGKVNATMNGQPVPPDHPLVSSFKEMGTMPPFTLQRDAQGRQTMAAGAPQAAQAINSAGLMAHFPDHPVRVGESWEVVQKVASSFTGPAGAAGPTEMDVRFTHTLKEIQVRDGRRQAIIESTGAGSLEQGKAAAGADQPGQEAAPVPGAPALQSLTQHLTGLTRFDIDKGTVVSGTFNMDIVMLMAAPMAAAAPEGAPGAPQQVRISGGAKVNFAELAADAAKPAAAKPAPRKR